eukprot:scaffold13210_cov19-Tisochrysis_lutea.AAC.1
MRQLLWELKNVWRLQHTAASYWPCPVVAPVRIYGPGGFDLPRHTKDALWLTRAGHLLSVLCTTLGGYASTFNDTSWARDAAASSSHATKDGAHCAAGALSRLHPVSLANGHSTNHGVNNSPHNHLPNVLQSEHPGCGSGQQAWHTTLRGRPNSALPKAVGVGGWVRACVRVRVCVCACVCVCVRARRLPEKLRGTSILLCTLGLFSKYEGPGSKQAI